MKNDLKEALRQGKTTFGAGVTIGHPDVPEILAHAGYDFIFFDTEHSPMNEGDVQRGLQALKFSKAVPIARVAWNDMVMIKKMLDIGVYGIIVPWVNTKEDAIKAVQAMRYPPEGMRGYGPRRASMGDPDYVSTANKELFLGIQIETQTGVDNLDDILSVEGIDATLIGPNDLSNSLGVFTQWDHPKYTSAVKKILETSIRHGVTPGVLAPFEWQKRLSEGFRMILVAIDFMLLQQGSVDALREARSFADRLGREK